MPPKKRPAGEDAAGEDNKKRVTSAAVGKSVTIQSPANGGPLAKTGATAARAGMTTKPGTARAPTKPGVRKGGAAAAANRARAAATTSSTAQKKEAPPPVITKNVLMWFRNDLRLQDNRALHAASLRSKIGNKNLVCLFIISEEEWEGHNEAPVKIDFWMRNLASLKRSLDKLSIPLIVKKAASEKDVVGLVESTVKDLDVSHVFWNAEYMVDEMKRDALVKKTLSKLPGTYVEEFEDQCIVSPKEIKSKTGAPYTTFKSYQSTWFTMVETKPSHLHISPAPDANPAEAAEQYQEHFMATIPSSFPHTLDQDEIEKTYPAGEEAAHERLREFVKNKLEDYHINKDTPHEDGNITLSPYIASGILSTRQCVSLMRASNSNKIMVGSKGVQAWVREIVWKEFYKSIMYSFPRVCKNKPFQPFTENFVWSNDDRKFQMWCQGKTGYPIVDAGMRQLNTIGYMHNRVRMLAACFLVKDLMINWQRGEKYFMSNLIDGDFACNNGGWQWCASTGNDPQPYFRIYNPLQISQTIDPSGDYIRQWVPELESLSDTQIHDPFHGLSTSGSIKLAASLNYITPIVKHAEAKKKYNDEYKRLLAAKGI